MGCEQYLEWISAALDGELTPGERRELDAHLAVCPDCQKRFELLSAQTRAVRELDCDFPAGLHDRIMNNLPAREAPVKKGKVIPWKRWAGLAACLVLVALVSIPAFGPRSGSMAAPEAARAGDACKAPGGAPVPSAVLNSEGAVTSGNGTKSPDVVPEAIAAPEHYYFANPQSIRVSYGATPEASSALVIGSVDQLADYLTQFSSQTWDGEGNELPIPELDLLLDTYGEEFFTDSRLLCVVVEAGSGSNRYELASQGLKRDTVTIREIVPEEGTCDMAAWLLVAEVDTMFNPGDTLNVEFSR